MSHIPYLGEDMLADKEESRKFLTQLVQETYKHQYHGNSDDEDEDGDEDESVGNQPGGDNQPAGEDDNQPVCDNPPIDSRAICDSKPAHQIDDDGQFMSLVKRVQGMCGETEGVPKLDFFAGMVRLYPGNGTAQELMKRCV